MLTALSVIINLLNWAVVIFFCVKASKAASSKGRRSSGAVLTTVLMAFLGAFVCAVIFLLLGAGQDISIYFSPVFIALGSFAGYKIAARD